MAEGTQRRLAAIVSADVVGYSRLMGVDEAGTLATMRAERSIFEDLINVDAGTETEVDATKTSLHGEIAGGSRFPSIAAFALTNYSGLVDFVRCQDRHGCFGRVRCRFHGK